MFKYEIKKNHLDKAVMTVNAEFHLGEIVQDKKDKKSIFVPMGIEAGKQIMMESMKNRIKNDDDEGFEKALAEYCKYWLNDILGLEQYPLKEKDGKIIGLKEEFEIGDDKIVND